MSFRSLIFALVSRTIALLLENIPFASTRKEEKWEASLFRPALSVLALSHPPDPYLSSFPHQPSQAKPSQPNHMAAASSSLLLPSLVSPKTLTSSRPKTLPLVSSPPSFSSSWHSLSVASPRCLSWIFGKPRNFHSVLIPNVAVSSEFEQEEEASGGDAVNFSPDLKLFVGNLPFNVDSAELASLFGRAGNVEMVEVIYDKLTGRSRGFGFVTMSTVEEVEVAAQKFNGFELEGRALRVNSGPPPPRDDFPSRGFRAGGGSDSTNRVYVGNLSWGVDDLALETLFSEQGKVLEAKVVYDRESGRSRGFGFVSYSSAEEVNNAISSLNGTDLDGRSIRVTMAEARPRRQF